ncbi:hypothetical protein [Streptomyces tricolor]|uniref:hypothetical protein n=1 Tax=Streptomyces tricolor TaxID=68277 RepID=UPI0036E58B73
MTATPPRIRPGAAAAIRRGEPWTATATVISDIAILLGLECNAELERARAIDSGHPPGEEPCVEPRDTRTI